MPRCKLAHFEAAKDGGIFYFQGVTADTVAADVEEFFTGARYRRETGMPTNCTYGIGSDLMRILFGAFAKRYKFVVVIQQDQRGVQVSVSKGMSGAMGGVIGYAAMNKESTRVIRGLQEYFA